MAIIWFLAGFIAGLAWLVPFAIGLKVKRNIETTGNLTGKVKTLEPIFRTPEQERELEERLDAQSQR